jgi:hypothetical protein
MTVGELRDLLASLDVDPQTEVRLVGNPAMPVEFGVQAVALWDPNETGTDLVFYLSEGLPLGALPTRVARKFWP